MIQLGCTCSMLDGTRSCPVHLSWTTVPAEERIDEPAKRFDAGKSRIDLIPPEFIEALGRHYAVGAAKYAERNWEKGMSWSRCYASAMRHLLAFWGGEEIDAETGTPHVIAAAWNLAALHWYGLHRAGTDDRPHFPIAST